MNRWIAILMLLCGCAAAPRIDRGGANILPPILQPAVVMENGGGAQPLTVFAPAPKQMLVYWNPGIWTNFVVVTSDNLAVPRTQWPTFAVTSKTNIYVPITNSCAFFTVYGTNSISQDFCWAIMVN